MTKLFALVAVMALMLGALSLTGAGASEPDETVRIRGENEVKINQRIQSTLSFHDEKARVEQGETLTWVREETTGEPHTITLADADDLPGTFDEVFECGGPGTACEPAGGHFTDPPTPVINAGAEGLDAVGDSLLMGPGEDMVAATVSAPAGTTLAYLCAIHPWMQGTIEVR